jgi:hypothetical protein
MTPLKQLEQQPVQGATDPAYPSGFLSLVPAMIEGSGNAPADGAMEVFLPGGARLSLTSANQVTLAVALIRQLEHARPC